MLAVVLKYRQAFLIGLQSNLVYRWNFAVRGFSCSGAPPTPPPPISAGSISPRP